jgi:DNA mismatch repair ATPase MutS
MPLLRIEEIEDRQKGLLFLNEHPKMVEDFRSSFKGLPDIEKLMSAIHSAGVRLTNHPENRAVYYEQASNAKTKISRLLTCLEGLTRIESMVRVCLTLFISIFYEAEYSKHLNDATAWV